MEQTRIDAKGAGQPRYLSRLPCKRGHIGERYTSNGNCVRCDNEVLAVRRRAKIKYVPRIPRGICAYCGNVFIKTNNVNKYCSVECRFWSKVDKRGPGDCWNWKGAKTRFGHGSFRTLDDRGIGRAHVYSFVLANGPVPKVPGSDSRGTCICHKCDNPACVNPAHLFAGSHADNMADMATKGRSSPNAHPPKKYREEDVQKALELYKAGLSQDRIAWVLGIHQTTISKMIRGIY